MRKVIVLGAILLVVAGSIWLVRGPYLRWKENRFLSRARFFLAKADYRNANLSAREILAFNPTNVEACRMLAEVAERVRVAQEAISWRTRVVELEPGNVTNRLKLARTAIMFGNVPRADRALLDIKPADRETSEFQMLAALVSIGEKDPAAAEIYYAKALKLEPQNKFAQFDLAVLHLQSTDPKVVDAACASLEQLCSDPDHRRDALRHLVLTALRRKDFTRAQVFSRQLQAENPRDFQDDILHLTVLKEAGSAEMSAHLASLEKVAAQNAVDLNTLVHWLRIHRMTDEAVSLLTSLPADMRTNRIAIELLADCHAERNEWPQVQSLLEDKKNWGDMEFVRLAKLARAYREQKQELQAQAAWQRAVVAASERLIPLTALLRMADSWGWNQEKEDIAWRIVDRFPDERGALALLNQLYTATGNTRGLQKIYLTIMRHDTSDAAAKNNFAAVSLLLNSEKTRACEIARENYALRSEDGIMASTYAYALYLQGRTQDGLKVLEKLQPDQLKKPEVAIYYGTLLAAAGQTNKAKPYLEIAAASPSLLPEEKALIAAARNTPVSSR